MQQKLQNLAKLTEAKLIGDPEHLITGVDDLAHASSSDASFLSNPLYRPLLKTTHAGVICIDPNTPLIEGKNYLISDNPSDTFQQIVKLFSSSEKTASGFHGIHPTAVIHPTAQIAQNVTIGPYSVVDAHCVIGEGTLLGPSVTLGAGVKIGTHSILHSHVTVREGCILGNRVILQPGAVIGSCGFGYTPNKKGEHQKQEQLGIVVLEDDVEVGANTAIDRARFKETRICRGTKIDNLVQIAHNCELGAHNIIVSQTGISGSVKTGRYVIMGGQTGTVGHVTVADGAMFAARSGIKKSITSAGKYGGNPAIPLMEHQREQVLLKNIKDHTDKIRALEEKLSQIQDRLTSDETL
ncbi:MAG TPA: UDP-3-O-(3-hydroxymyristoyl)glucosamine N-acyltransferase [Rhabdochlamydiaceae bacterium]|nr:UDP-3-O-(3-hydroxymyristoyl)glucosamine N-acyltransferase [Rhabdochlamydiaceae bacterium]